MVRFSKAAGASQRKVEARELQLAEFDAEEFRVPARVECELVIHQNVRATLRFREPGQANRRDLWHPKLTSGQNPTVTGDNPALFIDQDGVCPPNSLILPAISATWASEWVRALRA